VEPSPLDGSGIALPRCSFPLNASAENALVKVKEAAMRSTSAGLARFPVSILALIVVVLSSSTAWASSITWAWTGFASGSVGAVPVPNGTPFSIEVTFDTNAPNQCPPASMVGVYSPFPAVTRILGYQYTGFAGIESNSIIPLCLPDAGAVDFRVFAGSGVQVEPGGVLLPFGLGTLGDFFLGSPAAATLGGIPTTLPTNPFPTVGNGLPLPGLILTGVQITQITSVPEPATCVLVVIGLAGLAARRRRSVTN
jgi:PEP-CTERM motif